MKKENNFFVFCIAALVSVGGILYGYDIGVISGALLFVKKTIPLNDMQIGLIVGAVLGGGLVGTLISGPIGDYFGRRVLIIFASLIFLAGVTCVLLADTFALLFSSRLLLGIGVGIVSVAVPLYVAEVVSSNERGKYVTFFQLLLTFGIVLAYVVDLYFTPTGNWRAMFAVLLIPSLILFFSTFILPETPRWLVANNQIKKATQILQKLRQSENKAIAEVKEIQRGLQESKKSKWMDLFSYELIIPSLIAISIAIFNQLTGINLFLQYAPLILKEAGASSDFASMIGSAGIGALNFIFTLVAIALIDRVGRRPLLLVGVAGVVLSEIYLGMINTYYAASPYVSMLSLIGMLLFIMFFAIGPGVVVWLATSELFPTMVRGKGLSVCLFFNSLASALLSVVFLPVVKSIGMGETYLLFALFSFCYFMIVYLFLPETKACSLEEVQTYFSNREKESSLMAKVKSEARV